MEKLIFDNNNVWQLNADFLFGFQCLYCDADIGFEDVSELDVDEYFSVLCVMVSNEAQKRGWKFVEDYAFCCPTCAKKTERSMKQSAALNKRFKCVRKLTGSLLRSSRLSGR